MEPQKITFILALIALIIGLAGLTFPNRKFGGSLAAVAIPSAVLGFVFPAVGFYVLGVEAFFVGVVIVVTFIIGMGTGRC